MRLAIRDLRVHFGDRQVVAIDELSLGGAEIVGLAGESGSGKSMTTLAVLGLAHTVGATVRGSIALDGMVQAEVLALIRELRDRDGMSVLFISHDLAVVAELCDRVAIMRGGRIVEQGPAAAVLSAPEHDYTADLLAAVPRIKAAP